MITRIDIKTDNEEQRQIIDRLVEKYLHKLTPDWLTEVHLSIATNESFLAQVTINYQYRRIYLGLGPKFFGQLEEFRDRDFIHELAHVFLAPYVDVAESVMAKYAKKNDISWEFHEKGHEAATEDIAELMWRLFFSEQKTPENNP